MMAMLPLFPAGLTHAQSVPEPADEIQSIAQSESWSLRDMRMRDSN